jgi:hypothetical protein
MTCVNKIKNAFPNFCNTHNPDSPDRYCRGCQRTAIYAAFFPVWVELASFSFGCAHTGRNTIVIETHGLRISRRLARTIKRIFGTGCVVRPQNLTRFSGCELDKWRLRLELSYPPLPFGADTDNDDNDNDFDTDNGVVDWEIYYKEYA